MEEKTNPRKSFGELEQAILEVFENGNSYTIRDVLEHLSSENKYTTIMTVMQRLTLKGVLQRYRDGRTDVYTLAKRPSLSTRLLGYFNCSFFKMPSKLLARSLIEGIDRMEEEQLLEMEQWIRNKRLEKQTQKTQETQRTQESRVRDEES